MPLSSFDSLEITWSVSAGGASGLLLPGPMRPGGMLADAL